MKNELHQFYRSCRQINLENHCFLRSTWQQMVTYF